jgi:hypothetical protein
MALALPGLDSPSPVTEIQFIDAVAVSFFFLLVLFDVLAHFFSERKTQLEGLALVCFAIASVADKDPVDPINRPDPRAR